MLGERVTMSARPSVPARLARSLRTIVSSSPSFMTLRSETISRSGATGLTKKSTAPWRIAETTVSSEEWAVWTITGTLVPLRAIASSTAMPSVSGITRSRIMAP